MYGYIYETTCIPTGKKYIGIHKWSLSTIDPNYLGSGVYLRKAITKYGKENFTCRIIEWCETREQLLAREEYYISKYKAPINEQYYNINDGGQGGHSEYYVQPVTQKQLDALERGRHRPASEKLKKQLSEYRKSVDVCQETRDKLRDKQLGRKIINDGINNKYVKPEELDEYLNKGWKLGQAPKDRSEKIKKFKQTHYSKDNSQWKQNISNSIKNRRWVTNGVIDKQISPEEINKYLELGFTFGRCKIKN